MKMPNLTAEYLESQELSPTIVERFYDKFIVEGTCWIWKGALSKSTTSDEQWKYGMMFARWHGDRTNGKTVTVRAHIVSWIIHRGPIPNGLHVLHNCPGGDNPLCVNPDHLKLGTHADNMADMKAKGRANGGTKGEANHFAILTKDSVLEIRRLAELGIRRTTLSAQFGISVHHVTSIVARRAWRWL